MLNALASNSMNYRFFVRHCSILQIKAKWQRKFPVVFSLQPWPLHFWVSHLRMLPKNYHLHCCLPQNISLFDKCSSRNLQNLQIYDSFSSLVNGSFENCDNSANDTQSKLSYANVWNRSHKAKKCNSRSRKCVERQNLYRNNKHIHTQTHLGQVNSQSCYKSY